MKNKTDRKLVYVASYLGITLLLLTDIVIILTWSVSFAGYWSDRVMFWIWILSTVAFLIFFWKSIYTKIYLGVLILGVFLSIAPMMLPFYGILFSSTGAERRSHYTPEYGNYRMQLIQSVMSAPRLQIIENRGLLEKNIIHTDAEFLRNDSLKTGYEDVFQLDVEKDTKDSLTLRFHTPSRKIVKSFKRD